MGEGRFVMVAYRSVLDDVAQTVDLSYIGVNIIR